MDGLRLLRVGLARTPGLPDLSDWLARTRLRARLGVDAVSTRRGRAPPGAPSRSTSSRLGPSVAPISAESSGPPTACRSRWSRSSRRPRARRAGPAGWRLPDGEPAGAAALFVDDGAAATSDTQERRPSIAARARRAPSSRSGSGGHASSAATPVFTETGELLPDRPSASYRNILRAGFEELYVVPNWLSPRLHDEPAAYAARAVSHRPGATASGRDGRRGRRTTAAAP